MLKKSNTVIGKKPITIQRGIDMRIYGSTAYNSLANYVSSPRLVMLTSSHLSQAVPLCNPDLKILQSGIEGDLSKFVDMIKVENNSYLLDIINKFDTRMDQYNIDYDVEVVLFIYDMEKEELKHISIPKYKKTTGKFGFQYEIEYDYIYSLSKGDMIPADTVLAKPKSVQNGIYGNGKNLNVAMIGLPEVAEDAIVMSDEIAEQFTIKTYDTITATAGINSVFLNIYGDKDNYKPFPDIGEEIREDGLLLATRKYDINNALGLMGMDDLMQVRPMYDKTVYQKSGKVVNIDIVYNKKSGGNIDGSINDMLGKYLVNYESFYTKIEKAYYDIKREFKNKNGREISVSPATSLFLSNTFMMLEKPIGRHKPTITKVNKKDPLDLYTVTITTEIGISAKVGFKTTDLFGGKGVFCSVRPKSEMPRSTDGTIADIVVSAAGTVSRMNIGRLYEQYLTKVSRGVKKMVSELLGLETSDNLDTKSDDEVLLAFQIVLDHLSIMDTPQYHGYKAVTRFEEMREILADIIDNEFYLLYNMECEKKAYEIVSDMEKSKFTLDNERILIPDNKGGFKELLTPGIIAPLHMLLLDKIADDWLAASTTYVNTYAIPIGVSRENRNSYTYNFKPVRNISETEGRLLPSYGDLELTAELMNRSRSIPTHKHIYDQLLMTENPMDIDNLTEGRTYEDDAALAIMDAIIKPMGMELKYVKDEQRYE